MIQPYTACPDDLRLEEIEGEQIVASMNRDPDWRDQISAWDQVLAFIAGEQR